MTHEKLGYTTDIEMLARNSEQASPGKKKLKATSCEVAGTWRGGRSVEKVLSAINTQQPSEWINGRADRASMRQVFVRIESWTFQRWCQEMAEKESFLTQI